MHCQAWILQTYHKDWSLSTYPSSVFQPFFVVMLQSCSHTIGWYLPRRCACAPTSAIAPSTYIY